MHQALSLIQHAWSHAGFRRYLGNAGWLFGARVLTLAISFLATLYIARNLGPESYGQLSYALSFIALFGFIASLGIDGILYRDLIRFPQRKEALLGTALSIKIAAGAAAAATAIALSRTFAVDDVSSILILILAGTFVLNAFQIIQFEFQARADSKYPSLVAVGTSVILNMLKVGVIAIGEGVIYLAAILLFESVLYATAYLWIYTRRHARSLARWYFDRAYAVALLKDSFPLIALSAFSIIYARIDQVFIKHLIDAHAVGVYDAAVRVAEIWSFLPGLLIAALFPAIVNAKLVSEELYSKRLARLASLLVGISVGTALVISMAAPIIMRILYGEAFMAGVPVLQVYVWAFIGTSLGIFITQYLITENLRRILTFVAFVPMLVNVLLNILWIPQHGILGAAYATLISYSLMPFMLLIFPQTRAQISAMIRSLF